MLWVLRTGYVLNMTSQKWLDESIVTRPIWWHILVVVVPDNVQWEKNGEEKSPLHLREKPCRQRGTICPAHAPSTCVSHYALIY